MVQARNSRKCRKFSSHIQLPIIGDSFIGSPLWSTNSSTIARKMWSAVAVGKPYFTNPEKTQYPIERYSSGDLNSQPMKGKEGTPLMGLNTIRLSGSTLDHFNTQLVQPEEKNIVNINRQFERQSKASGPPRPSSKQSFVTLQQMKISSRTPKRLSQTKSDTKSDIDFGLGSLRITSKPKSTPMTVLGPLKRDRLTCSCSSCTERKIEKQKVGTDKSERLRILQEQQKYSDPIRGATDAFIHRIRELKSYDLDTAKQEQSESKRKKKKKI